MALDLKPIVKQQQHAPQLDAQIFATTPDLEQALLSFSAALPTAPHYLPALQLSSAGNPYPQTHPIIHSFLRPENSASPLSTASASSSVSPSPTSVEAAPSAKGSRPTAFPFDRTLDTRESSREVGITKSTSVASESVAAALAGLPLVALRPDMQDQLKKQRKKERNRVAAMKCRKKKLEREADLEERVSKLKGVNGELTSEVAQLRQQVCLLKQTVMKHVNGGCTMVNSAEYEVPSRSAN